MGMTVRDVMTSRVIAVKRNADFKAARITHVDGVVVVRERLVVGHLVR
jgi:hypothetical protein